MTQDEIEALMNGLSDDFDGDPNIKTIKYSGSTDSFYPSSSGYNTEEEAKFHFYYDEIKKMQLNIKAKKDDIIRHELIISNIYKNHSELFEKFSEELL